MTLIVDASVALKWFLRDEPQWREATALLRGAEPLIAPELIIADVCNAAWRGVRANRIQAVQAEGIARSLADLFTSLVPLPGLAERAIVIAGQLDHAVYDCFYLALSEVRDIPFVTADTRLLRRIEGTPWLRLGTSLADYRPGG